MNTRHVELEERKRRETNIVLFHLPEHNSPVELTNKLADDRYIKEISRYLGQESLNAVTLFRLGKKLDDKIRPLKVVLDSKSERKFLLENAKFIEEKVPEKFKRVIISTDMTNAQRAERKYIKEEINMLSQQYNENTQISSCHGNRTACSKPNTKYASC